MIVLNVALVNWRVSHVQDEIRVTNGILAKIFVYQRADHKSSTKGLRPPRAPKHATLKAFVTAYCPCELCCGKFADGITATGVRASRLHGCAVDPRTIPYGSRIRIPGRDSPLVADDTGAAMVRGWDVGNTHIDIRMASHVEALEWGKQYLEVEIEYNRNP